jgi:hypothetical protein
VGSKAAKKKKKKKKKTQIKYPYLRNSGQHKIKAAGVLNKIKKKNPNLKF